MVKLDTETKLITHAIRMAACNTETILARALNGRYAHAGDEAYALHPRSPARQRRHHHQRHRLAHPPGPAVRTPPHPRPGRPLRAAQHHQNLLPRNPGISSCATRSKNTQALHEALCQEPWGYQGSGFITPFKKPQGGELLDWQKEFNAQ